MGYYNTYDTVISSDLTEKIPNYNVICRWALGSSVTTVMSGDSPSTTSRFGPGSLISSPSRGRRIGRKNAQCKIEITLKAVSGLGGAGRFWYNNEVD